MVQEPNLYLETGFTLRDNVTDLPVRFEQSLPLGGAADAEWMIQEDLQVGVVAVFDANGKPKPVIMQDFGDAAARAAYYLAGMASKYELSGGLTRQYAGIMPIDPDGVIQQVTWSIGDGGPTTIASANGEHSHQIPPYPARRRIENLSANAGAALANLEERQAVNRITARPKGAVQ
jgi:hypothetical protein